MDPSTEYAVFFLSSWHTLTGTLLEVPVSNAPFTHVPVPNAARASGRLPTNTVGST